MFRHIQLAPITYIFAREVLDCTYVQAKIRPYIQSFDFLYLQVILMYLTLNLMYQILAIYVQLRDKIQKQTFSP